MTFYEHFHLPHFFSAKIKSQIEHLYASVAIGNLALAIIAIFEPIFLYSVVGLSIPELLWFCAGTYALYSILIILGGKIISRIGYSKSILISTVFMIGYWYLLLGSEGNVKLLIAAAVALAFEKALYWPSIHASMSRFSNKQQLGREFSMMYAIMNFMQIIGPMIGGLLSMVFGLEVVFMIGSIIYFCSAIPLFWSNDQFKTTPYYFRETLELYKKYPFRFLGYWGFGEELLVLTIWPIFIFTILNNFRDIGSLVTVATLVSTSLALYIGFYTDKHSKESLLRAGTLIYALAWLARIPVISPFGAFITDALSRTTKSLVFIPTSALTYQRAEHTQILPYIIGFEQMLSIGKALAAIVGIVVFAATGSFVALFIVGAIFSLFYFLI
jgi:MFS family permease